MESCRQEKDKEGKRHNIDKQRMRQSENERGRESQTETEQTKKKGKKSDQTFQTCPVFAS